MSKKEIIPTDDVVYPDGSGETSVDSTVGDFQGFNQDNGYGFDGGETTSPDDLGDGGYGTGGFDDFRDVDLF